MNESKPSARLHKYKRLSVCRTIKVQFPLEKIPTAVTVNDPSITVVKVLEETICCLF